MGSGWKIAVEGFVIPSLVAGPWSVRTHVSHGDTECLSSLKPTETEEPKVKGWLTNNPQMPLKREHVSSLCTHLSRLLASTAPCSSSARARPSERVHSWLPRMLPSLCRQATEQSRSPLQAVLQRQERNHRGQRTKQYSACAMRQTPPWLEFLSVIFPGAGEQHT